MAGRGDRHGRVRRPRHGGRDRGRPRDAAAGVTPISTATNRPPSRTVIEHWNGSAWTVVPIPDPSPGGGGGVLRSVQAASSTDIWAVGSYGAEDNGDSPLIVHWNGTRWAQVPSPSPGTSNQLTAVRALSASNAWAVGSISSGTTPSLALAIHCWARPSP